MQKDRKSGIQGFQCNVNAFENNTLHFWKIYESFPTMNDVRASHEYTKFMMDVCSETPPLICKITPCIPTVSTYSFGGMGNVELFLVCSKFEHVPLDIKSEEICIYGWFFLCIRVVFVYKSLA